MALTHETDDRNALCSAINDQVNAGTTNPSGRVVLMTGADVEVATCELSNPAYATPSGGSMAYNAITSDTDATGNASPVDKFKVVDRDGAEVYRGTVTATGGGGDITLDNTTVEAGATVNLSGLTYTASA